MLRSSEFLHHLARRMGDVEASGQSHGDVTHRPVDGGSNDLRNVGEVTAATQKTAISMLTSMRTSNLTGSALLPEKYPLSKKRAGQWCLLEIFLDKFALTAS